MNGRILQSDYMHWAKNQRPVTYALSSSEVAHFPLDRLSISIADLELTGASHYRYRPLREAIGAKHGVPADWVVAADGTSMANMLAMAALVGPGDELLIEQPTYEPLLGVARFLGADVKRFRRRPETGFALDPDEVGRAVTPATKLIVLTNLHNPSGALADEAALRAIGSLGPRVLVDEVYLDAAAQPTRSCVRLGDRFVATGSLTKVYGLSGLRCGWILAEPDLAERIQRLNELFGVAQAHADERLGCIALANLDRISKGTHDLLARNRALVNAFLASRPELDCAPLTGGITAFPRLLHGDPEVLDDLLRTKYDASIVPGRWFEMPDHFRLGYGGPTPTIEEGLARLGSALDEFK
ncbi:MAG TPA: aminotransferase class I/II-fold pyridoxal phosphate-dependent enzyme [Allosphingosinicella sp.]|nr:aminotransferase class I/II-fold pyridoxal phosphate-dependent enzyme [Allosphingosinicella sp.]